MALQKSYSFLLRLSLTLSLLTVGVAEPDVASLGLSYRALEDGFICVSKMMHFIVATCSCQERVLLSDGVNEPAEGHIEDEAALPIRIRSTALAACVNAYSYKKLKDLISCRIDIDCPEESRVSKRRVRTPSAPIDAWLSRSRQQSKK